MMLYGFEYNNRVEIIHRNDQNILNSTEQINFQIEIIFKDLVKNFNRLIHQRFCWNYNALILVICNNNM